MVKRYIKLVKKNSHFESTNEYRMIESKDFETYYFAEVDGLERVVYEMEGTYWVLG